MYRKFCHLKKDAENPNGCTTKFDFLWCSNEHFWAFKEIMLCIVVQRKKGVYCGNKPDCFPAVFGAGESREKF